MEGAVANMPKRPLVLAVRDGRLEEVKTLLASMILTDDEKFRFLYYAVFYNQVEVTKYLLQNGYDRFLNRHRRSRQLYGVAGQNSLQYGTVEIVEMLLANGVDFCNFSADALLEAAAKDGNMKFIKTLACRVKDRDQARLIKKTLISPTSSELQPQIFQLLLNYGSAGITIDEFLVIFFLAHSRGHDSAVKLLFNRANDFDLAELLNITVTKTNGWLPKTLQIFLEYGSTDLLFVNDPACISPLFEALNKPRPFFLNYHRSCAQILIQHVIKMKVANLYPPKEEYEAVIYKDKKAIHEFQEKCELELAAIKKECIGKSRLTYYDILTKDLDQLACLSRNESIASTLKDDEFRQKYPIYSSLIYNQFQKGEVRREMIEKVLKIYQVLISSFPVLPYDLKEGIVRLSCNRDLRNLILATDPIGS